MAKLKEGVLGCGLRGRTGSVVFARGAGGGTIVREAPYLNDPKSPAQTFWRGLVRRAGALWRTLTPEQADLWREYAEAVWEERQREGSTARPNASGLFVGLAAIVWRVEPSAAPPFEPPGQTFLGDGIGVGVSVVGASVRFTADGPNSGGVVTELMLQRLPSRVARPQVGKDRHQRYFLFAPGELSVDVTVAPGAYAASVRFVRAATGQVSGLVRVGIVSVE